ncbi:MAG: efflux RND transporter periplasmic adaptor subunit [Prevotellaceae bacterium]|jgi:RND family efflux transporter MFP subunit|nr:efflux RND transporter periplasmic adaptor subunit [Prevotellaceae bacterium]
MTFRNIIYPAILICIFSCSSNKSPEQQSGEKTTTEVENKPTDVKVKLLELQDFSYELISNGTIAAMNKAELKFQSQEIIRKIYVKNGERVSKGQKIAELDKFKLEMAMNQAVEALEQAKLNLQDVLIGLGYSISDTVIPAEVMKMVKIRSNHEQSQNNYTMAKYNLDAATLYAPFDGVVANLTDKEFNMPSGGEAFCTIIDNRRPEVIFHVLESELPLISLNDKIFVAPFSLSSYIVEGRISEINPMIEKASGMVRVKAGLSGNKDNKLYEGMNVKIRVQLLLGKQLVVPKQAVVLRTNRQVVFKYRKNKAWWVYVQTGQENSDSYVLTDDALKIGDSIIYEGNINLSDEAPVIVK